MAFIIFSSFFEFVGRPSRLGPGMATARAWFPYAREGGGARGFATGRGRVFLPPPASPVFVDSTRSTFVSKSWLAGQVVHQVLQAGQV